MDIGKYEMLKKAFGTCRIHLPANIYLLKVNNGNTKKRCEICSKLTIKTLTPFSNVSIIDFEQVNVSWDTLFQHILLVVVITKWSEKILL